MSLKRTPTGVEVYFNQQFTSYQSKSQAQLSLFFIILCALAKVEKTSQAKSLVVVGGESIRVNRIVRIEGELFVGEF